MERSAMPSRATLAGAACPLFVAGAGTSAPARAADAPFTVAALMRMLAERGPERARFTETKFLAILDKPIVASGELRYAPPDRLEKRTEKPRPESMVLAGDLATVERDGRTQTIRLSEYPEVAALVGSLRGTLAGDKGALERIYKLELYGTPERWTLVMLPADLKLATLVQRIDVAGVRNDVRSIEILQADGDRSLMKVERVKAAP
jgi:hypothetical protein